jgi:aspartyl-tRNA(Asn)/glutamyl-tRNA(Gln) amidotransferase subunit A
MHRTWTETQLARAEEGYVRFGKLAEGFTGADYAHAVSERHSLNHRLTPFFADHDLLLTPVAAITGYPAQGPLPAQIDGREVGPAAAIPFTFPWNITGHPAASVPAGLAPDGLPVGLQVIGPRFADGLVLGACAAYERARPWSYPELVGAGRAGDGGKRSWLQRLLRR